MAILPNDRKFIFEEETQFRAAVSEAVAQKIGSLGNFLAARQYLQKQFYLNGPYGNAAVVPVTSLDGLDLFKFDAEIIDIVIFNAVPGSSGTTELDVKIATTSGGPFTSIFTTTPKVNSTAGADAFSYSYDITDTSTGQAWAPIASPPTGITPAVLSTMPYPVNANTAIRIDMLQRMPGAENCGLLILYRPR